MIVLSHYQIKPALQARQDGKTTITLSPDLNRTFVTAELSEEGLRISGGEPLDYRLLTEIAENETACYRIENGEAQIVRAMSEETGRFCSLLPTSSAPTMLIGGFPMHRIKGTNPVEDTLSKIRAIAPIHGRVLDTTTGLGYTAIEAAKTALHVTTVELDPAAQVIARGNPWSQELFGNPKITQVMGDSYEEIDRFEPEAFSFILHDPPTLSLGGQLYSGEFYRRAFRVLKRGGMMFHYIGDPSSKIGARNGQGIVRRLKEAGFASVLPRPDAFGVVACKPRRETVR